MLLATLSPALATAAKPPVDYQYGPQPDWDRFKALAQAEITSRLIDPESARFAWLGGDYAGLYKPLLEPRVYGYVACGTVNARNRMGGYTGATTFIVVIDNDHVLTADIDDRPYGLVNQQCTKAIQGGLIPPLPTPSPVPSSATASSGASAPVSGLTLRAMPDGAYVAAVTPGSVAAAAGLKPGMVIASVNAIPLAGMGDAMLAVVNAAGPGATLLLVGGTSVSLGTRP